MYGARTGTFKRSTRHPPGACPERALTRSRVPVLPKHHHDTVRVANGKVANSIGTRLDRNFDGDPPSDDLLVQRVHVPDPECEDRHVGYCVRNGPFAESPQRGNMTSMQVPLCTAKYAG
jgi:hypothetical protein